MRGTSRTVVAAALTAALVVSCQPKVDPQRVLDRLRRGAHVPMLVITYPFDGSIFPPEIVPPTARWDRAGADLWVAAVELPAGEPVVAVVDTPQWTLAQWERVKAASQGGQPARLVVVGLRRSRPDSMLCAGMVRIRTSTDSVGDALFYREVNLPFSEAVRDPSRIRWRFGPISSPQAPPSVLEGLPVCGNCHSFSADGRVLGMDVDYANDKGSYAMVETAERMVLSRDRILTWCDYRREDRQPTFGLLSQVSPDGRYAVSTVKDRSVFVARPDLAFSQLFFPVKGILAIYDSDRRTFTALRGADDTTYVQSNPSWSPDGRHIVFCRAPRQRLRLRDEASVLLSADECREYLERRATIQYDLYRVPFNGGRGGRAEPLPGASGNGLSNFFPRYSPDGRWIVFCRAASFMLLQSDSRLYIMPSAGGEARPMRCNTPRMNSWHSWSSNSRWLVFASKAYTPYTQLFLTHVDSSGMDAPPVLLEHLTAPDRAANIPEFVRLAPGAIAEIRERFVDDLSWMRASREFYKAGDLAEAERTSRKALELNPDNAAAHAALGTVLGLQRRAGESLDHLRTAVRLDSGDAATRYNLGMAYVQAGRLDSAHGQLRAAIGLDPGDTVARERLAAVFRMEGMHDSALACYRALVRLAPGTPAGYHGLGGVHQDRGELAQAAAQFRKALAVDPAYDPARRSLAQVLQQQGRAGEALVHYRALLDRTPDDPLLHYQLARCLHELGRAADAVVQYRAALELKPDLAAAQRQLDEALAQVAKGDSR